MEQVQSVNPVLIPMLFPHYGPDVKFSSVLTIPSLIQLTHVFFFQTEFTLYIIPH